MKHPMQKIENGRFVANEVVRYLLDHGGIDLNDIARKGFPPEDEEQFAQLIGYSVSGFGSLSYVSDECFCTAEQMMAGVESDKDARIAALESMLEAARKPVRDAAVALFAIHPDDLSPRPE